MSRTKGPSKPGTARTSNPRVPGPSKPHVARPSERRAPVLRQPRFSAQRRAIIPALAAVVLAAVVLAGAACSPPGSREFMSLGTAGTGGIYYPLGGALASRLSVMDTTRQYTAEVSGGSVENVNRLRERQTDLAFATGNTIYEAAVGGQDYEDAVEELRILAPLYPNMTHVLVSRSSTATSVADLRGGTVSVGAAGSGTEQMARQVLGAYDLTYDDVTPRYLSFTESATALKDGALDAAIISVGYPAAAVLEATTTGGARLLAIEVEKIDLLQRRYPYYSRGTIPQGAYPAMDGDVTTAAVLNWVVAMSDIPEDVVDHVLQLLADERDELGQVHEMVHQIRMGSLLVAPIEVHPTTQSWMTANLPGAGSS